MCTVSVVSLPPASADPPYSFRMVCNRDESPLRTPAEPPRAYEFGKRQALLPRDPSGGGTWIAVNDAGLCLTLLNHNLPRDQRPQPNEAWSSRGKIITSLLACDETEMAVQAAALIDPTTTAPFRLVILDGRQRGLVVSDSRTLQHRVVPQRSEPIVFASSGLGDEVVSPPREALFEELVAQQPAAQQPQAQDRYHRHSWDDRRHVSVCMSRDGAATLSCTEVTVAPRQVTMRYLPSPPDQPGDWHERSLPRVHP